MDTDRAWTPPQSFEERLRGVFVPPRLVTLYHLKVEQARGEQELGLVPFLASRERVAVDAGANRGVWSEVMRRHSLHVHAFEPNPKLFTELRRGAGEGVTPHLLALSDQTGTAELRVPKGQRGYSNQGASLSVEKIGAAPYGSINVKTSRLDDLDIGDVGFIKIDVEGHENAVVEGARNTLRRCRPNLIIEIEEKHTHRPIFDLLSDVCSHGYEAFALYRGGVEAGIATKFRRYSYQSPHERQLCI